MTREEAKLHFANKLAALRDKNWPNNLWAERYGLSYGAIRDLAQARVLPSRAMVLLMTAIEYEPEFMQDVARAARDDLAILDQVRCGRSALKYRKSVERGRE